MSHYWKFTLWLVETGQRGTEEYKENSVAEEKSPVQAETGGIQERRGRSRD